MKYRTNTLAATASLIGAWAIGGSALAFQAVPPFCPTNGICNGTGPGGQLAPQVFQRGQGLGRQIIQQPTVIAPLTVEETSNLLYLCAEEKLARDLYLAFYDKWQDQIFLLSNAEQRHLNALRFLIQRHDLDDPVTDDTRGVFTNPEFTKIYEDLVDAGSQSLQQALDIGLQIEELNISDHQHASAGTTQQDLLQVYGNLTRASRNHLRAFASRRPTTEPTYQPQHISQEDYDLIVRSTVEPGPGWQGRARFAANTPGRGMRPGRGMGIGQGMALGQGMGRGQGIGRGQGLGLGQGIGRGQGLGLGPAAFLPRPAANCEDCPLKDTCPCANGVAACCCGGIANVDCPRQAQCVFLNTNATRNPIAPNAIAPPLQGQCRFLNNDPNTNVQVRPRAGARPVNRVGRRGRGRNWR